MINASQAINLAGKIASGVAGVAIQSANFATGLLVAKIVCLAAAKMFDKAKSHCPKTWVAKLPDPNKHLNQTVLNAVRPFKYIDNFSTLFKSAAATLIIGNLATACLNRFWPTAARNANLMNSVVPLNFALSSPLVNLARSTLHI